MAINYDDERFKAVENEKNSAIERTTNEYNNMINESQGYYQQQIDAQKDWANKQSEIQQANTDFAIEKIEQQKAQTEKDYLKEQKGAYTDYQKAIDEYGVNAERRATAGLQGSGYSESSKISAYNTYQNRYATARESYNNALMNYTNAIKEAQLANSSALATIAYQSLQAQLELSLQGFQYKNTLVLQKMSELNNVNDRYYNRYQDVVSQINTENSLAEQIRQYNESLALQKQKAQQEQENWEREMAFAQQKYNDSLKASTSSYRSSGGSGNTNTTGNTLQNNNNSGTNLKSILSNVAGSIINTAQATKNVVTKTQPTAKDLTAMATNLKNIINTTKSKDTAKQLILESYKNGNLSDSEVETLSKKVGITW